VELWLTKEERLSHVMLHLLFSLIRAAMVRVLIPTWTLEGLTQKKFYLALALVDLFTIQKLKFQEFLLASFNRQKLVPLFSL
jgi:hypothetical protein